MAFSRHSSWDWSYISIDGDWSETMLNYQNTTTHSQFITSVHFLMGTGNGTFTGGSTQTGTGQPYYAQASCKDSNGVTIKSEQKTITNKVDIYYSGVQKTTFTFTSPVYVAAGATVVISLLFDENVSGYPVVICRGRESSSNWGGTVIDSGLARVRTGSAWKTAAPYVFTGGKWKQAVPYVYTGGKWVQCK